MALKVQGTPLKIESARTASKTITAITAASPPVVTSTAHGLTNGGIVYIEGVAGMTQVNKRAFVVANVTANTFELKGINGSAWSAYTSGGSAYGITQIVLGEMQSFSGLGGQADEIDVTNTLSTAKEYLIGLEDPGDATVEVTLAPSDAGQIKAEDYLESQGAAVFTLTLVDGSISAFVAFVRSFSKNLQQQDAVRATIGLRLTGKASRFA